MTLNGSVQWITKTNQPYFTGRRGKQLLAVGAGRIYCLNNFWDYTDDVVGYVNLENGTTQYATLDNVAYAIPLSGAVNKSGYLDFECLHTKGSEAHGSRVLYRSHYLMNLDTLDVASSTTTALSGPNLDYGPEFGFLNLSNGTILMGHNDRSNVIIVDLNSGTYYLSANAPTTHYYIEPQALFIDRTNQTPYAFCAQHYWSVTNFTKCLLYDLKADSWVESNAYDCNAGAICFPLWYKGTDDLTRFIYTGTSSEFSLGAYYSNYHLVYADNDLIAAEASVTGGAAYTSGTGSNIPIFVLGITADDTLACVTASYQKTPATAAFDCAMDLIETNNLLGAPSKVAHASIAIGNGDVNYSCQPCPQMLLLEKDWSYRYPIMQYPYSETTLKGTMNIAKITVNEDIEPNPYGVILVPP
jgi:hypothetical protein